MLRRERRRGPVFLNCFLAHAFWPGTCPPSHYYPYLRRRAMSTSGNGFVVGGADPGPAGWIRQDRCLVRYVAGLRTLARYSLFQNRERGHRFSAD